MFVHWPVLFLSHQLIPGDALQKTPSKRTRRGDKKKIKRRWRWRRQSAWQQELMTDNRVSCKITARYTWAACIAKHNSSSNVVTCVEVQFEKKTAITSCNIKMLWLLTLQTHNCIVVCCKTAIYLNSWWFKSTVNPKFKKSHHLVTHLHVGVGVSQNSAVLTLIVATDLKVKKNPIQNIRYESSQHLHCHPEHVTV